MAVEPASDNFELLCRNTAARRIASVHAGVSRTDGFPRVADAAAEKWAYQTLPAAAGESGAVRAMTVPALLNEWPKERGYESFIAKFDVEGAEAEIFSGDTKWIDAFSVIVIEPHDWQSPGRGHSRPVLRALAERDRDFFVVGRKYCIRGERLVSIVGPSVASAQSGAVLPPHLRRCLRPIDVPPGDYVMPMCAGENYNSPELKRRWRKVPIRS